MSDSPKPGRRVARTFVVLLILVVIVAVVGVVVLNRMLFTATDNAGPDTVIEIQPGQGLRTVSEMLSRMGMVPSARALEIYGRLQNLDTQLQAGRYLVSSQMTPVEILRKMVDGDAVFEEVVVTILEGWSADEIEQHLEEIGLFTRMEFQEAVVMQPAYREFDFLSAVEDDTILDGYLFPDTYRVLADSTPETVVIRMLTTFGQRVTPEIRDQIAAQDRTLNDVLILASIVQEEAGNNNEMGPVAGVFWNRLDIWMPLESDATVNYVLGTNKRQPTFADTKVQDPYNTYVNYGLPPGPIGNPGLNAILASVDPDEHEFLFFLHPLGEDIVLSRTFAEHLANKALYLD